MQAARQCSRNACSAQAIATLTYVYSDSTAVLGPLAATAEPHSYDLCERHAARTTAPRGWDVVRLHNTQDLDQAQPLNPAMQPAADTATADAQTRAQHLADISRPAVAPTDDWTVLADVLRASQETRVPDPSQRATSAPVFENSRKPRHARTNLFVVRNEDSIR